MLSEQIKNKKNRQNEDYCRRIVNNVIRKTRFNFLKSECQGKRTKYKSNVIWDYPAVAITSFDGNGEFTCSNYSRTAYPNTFNRVLTEKLNNLAPDKVIGDNRLGTIIGHCAEPHAANQTMNKYFKNKGTELYLDDIYFSLALRPRTMEVIKTCHNCKDTFPNLQ